MGAVRRMKNRFITLSHSPPGDYEPFQVEYQVVILSPGQSLKFNANIPKPEGPQLGSQEGRTSEHGERCPPAPSP